MYTLHKTNACITQKSVNVLLFFTYEQHAAIPNTPLLLTRA